MSKSKNIAYASDYIHRASLLLNDTEHLELSNMLEQLSIILYNEIPDDEKKCIYNAMNHIFSKLEENNDRC